MLTSYTIQVETDKNKKPVDVWYVLSEVPLISYFNV